MKIKWVGAYEKIQEFPKSQLPSHAKRVDSYKSVDNLINSSFIYFIPIVLIFAVVKILKIFGGFQPNGCFSIIEIFASK
jgi:hypothetical protein